MRWPAARITAPDQRATTRLLIFAGAELVLALAIPFIMIRGYHTLLSSNTGTFVDSPTVDEPGWSAIVSATPIMALVEVADGGISGVALIIPPGGTGLDQDEEVADDGGEPQPVASGVVTAGGGTIVLLPGDLSLPTGDTTGTEAESLMLADVDPGRVGDTVAELVNLDLTRIVVMDEGAWAEVLADKAYQLDNPDPVPTVPAGAGSAGSNVAGADDEGSDDEGSEGEGSEGEGSDETDDGPARLAFAVGPVSVGGADAAVFLGRPVDGGSLSSVMPRRREFWSATIDSPPGVEHPLASAVRAVGSGGHVVELPTVAGSEGPVIDALAAEDLLRDIVAFPSGNRLEVRVVDRTGRADLGEIAAHLAVRGIEVAEIANAVHFDDGSTELIRPQDLVEGVDQLDVLVAELGVEPLVDPEQEHDMVTLLVGTDFALER